MGVPAHGPLNHQARAEDRPPPPWLGALTDPEVERFASRFHRALRGVGLSAIRDSRVQRLDAGVEGRLQHEWVGLVDGVAGRDLVVALAEAVAEATAEDRRRAEVCDLFHGFVAGARADALDGLEAEIRRLTAEAASDPLALDPLSPTPVLPALEPLDDDEPF